jgi:hypothetical protein
MTPSLLPLLFAHRITSHHIISEQVNFLRVRAPFGPAVVEHLSRLMKLPKNMMFITCPDSQLRVRIDKLGGLRVITH